VTSTAKILLDRVAGLVFAGVCLGSAVYALVAVPMELPPVSWIIDREALFRGGTYGMVEAWAVSWFHLLAAGLFPLVLFALASTLRSARPVPGLAADVLERASRMRLRRALLGAAIALATAGFYAAIVLEPEVLEPVGFLGRLGLIVGPFAAYGGPALLLDGVLPLRAQVVVVQTLQEAPEDAELRSLNARWSLEPAQAAGLAIGSEASIVSTPVFDSVVAITPLPLAR
jgi:hypothetical protein